MALIRGRSVNFTFDPSLLIEHPPLMFDQSIPENVSKTKQSFKKESDINLIVAKAKRNGILGNPLATRQLSFGDFTSVPDFFTVQDRLARVNSDFESLPASVRDRFPGGASDVIEFIVDPANDAEAIKLGLKRSPVPAGDTPAPAGAPAVSVPNPAPVVPPV